MPVDSSNYFGDTWYIDLYASANRWIKNTILYIPLVEFERFCDKPNLNKIRSFIQMHHFVGMVINIWKENHTNWEPLSDKW